MPPEMLYGLGLRPCYACQPAHRPTGAASPVGLCASDVDGMSRVSERELDARQREVDAQQREVDVQQREVDMPQREHGAEE